MKQLYEVEIRAYVLADDEYEAATIALRECQPEEAEVYEAHTIDALWWSLIPYGSDNDKTCGEIVGAATKSLEGIAAARGE